MAGSDPLEQRQAGHAEQVERVLVRRPGALRRQQAVRGGQILGRPTRPASGLGPGAAGVAWLAVLAAAVAGRAGAAPVLAWAACWPRRWRRCHRWPRPPCPG